MNNAQSNVTPIESKQPQPTCRFTIQAAFKGFPIEISGEGRAGDLKLIIDRLLQSDAEPPQVAKHEPTKASGTPLCPVHNSPMKASRKPGSWFCPRQTDSGGYCPHKA
jgi:hypothetical protein